METLSSCLTATVNFLLSLKVSKQGFCAAAEAEEEEESSGENPAVSNARKRWEQREFQTGTSTLRVPCEGMLRAEHDSKHSVTGKYREH